MRVAIPVQRAVLTAGLLLTGAVCAQSIYPTKALTIVVPFSTGGSTDLITRLLARELAGRGFAAGIGEGREFAIGAGPAAGVLAPGGLVG